MGPSTKSHPTLAKPKDNRKHIITNFMLSRHGRKFFSFFAHAHAKIEAVILARIVKNKIFIISSGRQQEYFEYLVIAKNSETAIKLSEGKEEMLHKRLKVIEVKNLSQIINTPIVISGT